MRSISVARLMAVGLVLVISTLLASSAALAVQFNYLAQARSVSSFSAIDQSSESFSASDFGPFIATASSLGGSATHSSSLDVSQIELEVSTNSFDAASSQSLFSVSFSLAEDASFSLTGSVGSTNGTSQQPFLRLEEIGGNIIFESDASFLSIDPVDASGVLLPGTYELSAVVIGDGFAGDGDVSALFVITEPAVVPVPSIGGAGRVILGILLSPAAALAIRRPRRAR